MNISSNDWFKSDYFNVNDKDRLGQSKKLENANLHALLDKNPAQSTRVLNLDCTIVTKRLHATGKINKERKRVSHQLY